MYEKKKIQSPELQTDFDLNNIFLSKNDKDNKNMPQHYSKTYFCI